MNHDEFEDISQPPPPGGGLFDPTLRPNGEEPQAGFAPSRPPANGKVRPQERRPAHASPAPFEPPSSFDAPDSFSAAPGDSGTALLRVPPHSVEAESSVLGGLLLDNSAWDRVGDLLRPDDFYRYEHRLVFETVEHLVNASQAADVVTVFERLRSLGKDESAGGLQYLNSLAQYVPSAANIRRYAELVRERAILRRPSSPPATRSPPPP